MKQSGQDAKCAKAWTETVVLRARDAVTAARANLEIVEHYQVCEKASVTVSAGALPIEHLPDHRVLVGSIFTYCKGCGMSSFDDIVVYDYCPVCPGLHSVHPSSDQLVRMAALLAEAGL